MATHVPYRPRTGDIPNSPGVYRFLGENGRILYVGKAKSLRQRLSNYFAPLDTLHERTRHMVTAASSVEWTVVQNERESLQLEYTWIQQHKPPFNVRLKDDKSYPYLAVTLADESPRVMVTRNHRIRGARYFGPYPKVWSVNEVIDLMVRVFPIRTCNDANYKRAMQSGRPCFAGQIGRCGGPCSQRQSIEQHRVAINDFIGFMERFDRSIIGEFERRMREAAAAQRYEEAAKYRDRIAAVENVLQKSAVVLPDDTELDVFAIATDELSAAIQLFSVRGGRIRGVRGWVLDTELDLDEGTIIQQSMQQVYGGVDGDGERPPNEVIVPTMPEEAEALQEWLEERRGGRVRLRTAKRGPKADLLHTAAINATESLGQYKLKRTADYAARADALAELQRALELDEAPLRIECFDVSHLQGTGVVASMVVFEDGLPRKPHYRRFNIAETRDDTDSIHQVLTRRLAHLKAAETEGAAGAAAAAVADVGATPSGAPDASGDAPVVHDRTSARFAYRPQLLLVDGGQPQVAAAKRALDESGLTGIAVAGIAKRLEELWLPDDSFPVILPRGSEALFLVQRLRDEAHRFAIAHQRARRKRDIATVLSEVPGLGPARIRALLRHFGSVTRLRAASEAELGAVPGVGPTTAAGILRALAPSSAGVDDASAATDDRDLADGGAVSFDSPLR
ncbi:UvrABC system protein C [Pseudoclavibacter endophyticus]|uniref:UvrABC system protein C n=1 Tax=Pseudoclavibacter endophyticus TaxID=1778590 RepID=A0A6H9WGP6_9MICO|nr:excinuclease ABC subunit UvrC [Pseudoclavibacter endophyticus]KAB1650129.1 excinuclease ABC subunit UvrC [Pseudoclavibacter endophyticus]GGA56894.1 UvrABC system protein C [Pseudoclavibacter endophyticus]